MPYCANCGAHHEDSAEFCPGCGSQVSGHPQSAGATRYGGFWIRAAAILIDAILLSIVIVIVGALAGLSTAARAPLGFVVEWVYFAGLESSSLQATLGKKALGLRVTDVAGNRISFGRASARYFAKILSALTIFVGYIMAGFTDRKRALHDMIAGTLVERA
ncbi:MAG TPA: RDD family protein [Gaiellales bacterium]|nr:RDD family protein [Gaiellales bacterium]